MSTSVVPTPTTQRSLSHAQSSDLSGSRSDAFLSARVSNGKRADRTHRPSFLGASSQTLEIVPEDGTLRRRSMSYNGPDAKGKGRQEMPRSESMESLKRRRTDWLLDVVEAGRGAKNWADGERVVLVTGCPSAESLAPLLYNPTFENTLVLVGTVDPIPSIEALTSPSFLLRNSSERAIFPTVQPFNLEKSSDDSHPLPAIIQKAASLAVTYRKNAPAGRPRIPSRRDSTESGMSLSPPKTPPPLNHLSSGRDEIYIRRLSDSSGSDSHPSSISESARPEVNKRNSESSLKRNLSRPLLSMNTSSRDSFFGSLSKSKTDKPWSGGSPIDAVINFVPPASDFQSQRAMQEMLHQAVVLTTGIIPVLARRQAKSTQNDPTPVSIMHVLPSQVPAPLPGVLENFLLGLLPKFAPQSDRELWSSVVSTPAWLAPPRQVGNEAYSGSEVLIFGGLRCDTPVEPGIRSRAFLSNWKSCIESPGVLSTVVRNRSRTSSARATPASAIRPLHLSDATRAGSEYPRSPVVDPTTPELDSSVSTCSSASGVGQSSSAGSSEAVPEVVSGEKQKGLGWFKLRSKKSVTSVR